MSVKTRYVYLNGYNDFYIGWQLNYFVFDRTTGCTKLRISYAEPLRIVRIKIIEQFVFSVTYYFSSRPKRKNN